MSFHERFHCARSLFRTYYNIFIFFRKYVDFFLFSQFSIAKSGIFSKSYQYHFYNDRNKSKKKLIHFSYYSYIRLNVRILFCLSLAIKINAHAGYITSIHTFTKRMEGFLREWEET